jgi:carboxymethylenebutenolidase
MEKIMLTVADGTLMQAHVCKPQKPKAGLIVFQEAFGVNSHIFDLLKKFAELGFAAIAPELFHRTLPAGTTFGYDQFEVLKPHFMAITEKGTQQDAQACFDWLKASAHVEKVASIGYCMGGRASFVANAAVPLSCAISYYGGRIAPALLHLSKEQKSPLLFFWGGQDKGIPPEQIQAINQSLREAGKTFSSVEFSFAQHAFSNDERPTMYSAEATRLAESLALQFLKEHT